MATYFVGQSKLRIILRTEVTLTGYTCWMKYRKPDNKTTGYWVASILGSDATKMYYDVLNRMTIDQAGAWTFWSFYFLGDQAAPGEIVTHKFVKEGYSA